MKKIDRVREKERESGVRKKKENKQKTLSRQYFVYLLDLLFLL